MPPRSRSSSKKSGGWCPGPAPAKPLQCVENGWCSARERYTFPDAVAQVGIGPRAALSQLDIECTSRTALALDAIWRSQYLHYAITIPKGARVAPSFRHYFVAGIGFSSAFPNCPQSDLLILGSGRVGSHPFGCGLEILTAALYTPLLARGRQAQKRGSSRDARNRLQHV